MTIVRDGKEYELTVEELTEARRENIHSMVLSDIDELYYDIHHVMPTDTVRNAICEKFLNGCDDLWLDSNLHEGMLYIWMKALCKEYNL